MDSTIEQVLQHNEVLRSHLNIRKATTAASNLNKNLSAEDRILELQGDQLCVEKEKKKSHSIKTLAAVPSSRSRKQESKILGLRCDPRQSPTRDLREMMDFFLC